MKVIIAGSRHMPTDLAHIIPQAVKASGFEVTEVVCGLAKGADRLGWIWASSQGIPARGFPAEWARYGKGAGPKRNKQMAEYADALIVFIWDRSRGSENMLKQMQDMGKPCFVVRNGVLPGGSHD